MVIEDELSVLSGISHRQRQAVVGHGQIRFPVAVEVAHRRAVWIGKVP